MGARLNALVSRTAISQQSSSRNGETIRFVLWHHTASVSADGAGVVAMMVNATRQVSANGVTGHLGNLTKVVEWDRRAWTSGSTTDGGKGALFDRRSLTFECCNVSGAPTWGQSEAFYALAARIALAAHQDYGIPLDREHHIGHRELYTRFGASYPTACPGGMDIDRILAMARSLLDPAAVEREKATVRAVGTYLNSLHLGLEFPGWGDVQTAAASDGIPQDPGTTFSRYFLLVQMWGRKYTPDLYPPANDIDGIAGPYTYGVDAVLRSRVLAGTAPGQVPPPPAVVTEGSGVTLTKAQPVYPSAVKARNREGSTATYQAGQYTAHRVYGDAVNITKTPGKAGGWVMASAIGVVTNEWLVTFDRNDTSGLLSSVEVALGQPVAAPADPVWAGHEFEGWFVGDATEPYDFATPVTGLVTLTARWAVVPAPEPEPEPVPQPTPPSGGLVAGIVGILLLIGGAIAAWLGFK